MVPHRRILRAVALIAQFSARPAAVREELGYLVRAKFPNSKFQYFWVCEVLDALPPELQTAVETAQPVMQAYADLFKAAEACEVSKYISISVDGPTLNLPPDVQRWRQHDSIRLALEVMFLCNISVTQISDDMFRMYGVTFSEDDLRVFQELFCDSDYAEGAYWTNYAECIGPEELVFKARLRGEPKDFVRWKLGVPVALDSETVIHRLISDAYYTERMLKAQRRDPCDPHALPDLDRDDLSRIKMERDTMFKGIDRLLKMKELNGNAAGGVSAAHAELRRIIVDYTGDVDFPSLDELDA